MSEHTTTGHEAREQPRLEEQVYRGVYHVLLWGMLVSNALFTVGVVRSLMKPGYISLDSRWITERYQWAAILRGVMHADPTYLMLAGTAVLTATPVLRVIVSIHAFYVEGDKKYVAVTASVLAIILLTVALAHFGLQ